MRACLLGACAAQVVDFEAVQLPPIHSLQAWYAFYVFSVEDSPEKDRENPARKPFFTTKDLVLTAGEGGKKTLQGIELTLVRYEDDLDLYDLTSFCCSQELYDAGLCYGAEVHRLRPARPPRPGELVKAQLFGSMPQVPINTTGIYALVMSNCGEFTHAGTATLSGKVIVKHTYGFLPGIDHPKRTLYAGLALAYGMLCVMWAALLLRWWQQIFHMQACVAGVLVLSVVEVFTWWLFYNDWNAAGTRSTALFSLALAFAEVKSIFSYMLLFVASLGWGVTTLSLEQRTKKQIRTIVFFYIFLDTLREVAMDHRYEQSLNMFVILMCLLPISGLNGYIFFSVMSALTKTMDVLRQQNQTQKLRTFKRLSLILTLALAGAAVSFATEIYGVTMQSRTTRWALQWIYTDMTWRLLTLGVLFGIMVLWKPHKDAEQYVCSHQISSFDDDDVPPQELGRVEQG